MQSSLSVELLKDLERLKSNSRLRCLRTTEPFAGQKSGAGGRRLLNLASNDYLGFGSDVETHRMFLKTLGESHALADIGFASTGSRLLSGNHPAYAATEKVIQDAYGRDKKSLILNSGYHANIGVLPALSAKGDLILSDRLNHASLLDGIRLSRAEFVRYRHLDVEHAKELLARRRSSARRAFIVTESIFSMDGDRADLQALVALKKEFDAVLYVDEAHAIGVRGRKGLGLAEEAGVLQEVDILVGTFGKALASLGAFVVSDSAIHEYLVNAMRSLIFTTALPPVILNWSRYVFLRMLEAEDRRAALTAVTARFRGAMAAKNIKLSGDTHIVPLLVGNDMATVELSRKLEECGYIVPPIRPPTVPEGSSRLRFSLGAAMALREIDLLAERLGQLGGPRL